MGSENILRKGEKLVTSIFFPFNKNAFQSFLFKFKQYVTFSEPANAFR